MDKNVEKFIKLGCEIQRAFKNFYLAGGTAIMLKFNHRESKDLDFFSEKSFSFLKLSRKIRKIFNIQKEEKGEDNIDFYIKGIKVSFVFFPFKNIEKTENFRGIKKASDYDVFLNKIYAAGRRIDSKDPYDAAFLYKTFKWDENRIKRDFEKKFPNQSYEIYLGALLNFDDYPNLPLWVKNELKKMLDLKMLGGDRAK